MTEIEKKAEIILCSLQKSVHQALDKKKRLGQYAVVWHNGEVVRLFENDNIHVQDK